MKSDLHETFSVFQDWSLELIDNGGGHAHACMHAQCMETCMQLGKCDTPQFLSQINSDFHKTWNEHGLGINDAPKQIWSDMCMYASAMRMSVHACLYIWQ